MRIPKVERLLLKCAIVGALGGATLAYLQKWMGLWAWIPAIVVFIGPFNFISDGVDKFDSWLREFSRDDSWLLSEVGQKWLRCPEGIVWLAKPAGKRWQEAEHRLTRVIPGVSARGKEPGEWDDR